MGRISVLDCTLRDGGYINHFAFGYNNMQNIISLLGDAEIDIVECGFLISGENDRDKSLFGDVQSIRKIIAPKKPFVMYVAMLQYGKLDIKEIDACDGQSVDGIRLTFHKDEVEAAFVLGKQLQDKGYRVFMQPVGTTTYSEDELLHLMVKVNELNPYAFYMVDTLGTMYAEDVMRMYRLYDKNINPDISIGFHAHNNLQLAFSNSQELIRISEGRNIILDSTVQGLGRGAGNLCTELILHYINRNVEYAYNLLPIIKITDEYIDPMKTKYSWGYSAEYYLSAIKNCHPNYATYLMSRQTLAAEDVCYLLDEIPDENKTLYDEERMAKKYAEYKSNMIDDSIPLEVLRNEIGDREVLLVAPGKKYQSADLNSLVECKEKYFVISINFMPEDIVPDRVFFSNIKRYKSEYLSRGSDMKMILSSNLCEEGEEPEDTIVVNYSSYINVESAIKDNAGLMCINLLRSINKNKLTLIGFDGFDENQHNNYAAERMQVCVTREELDKINAATTYFFKKARKDMDITFLTESSYE